MMRSGSEPATRSILAISSCRCLIARTRGLSVNSPVTFPRGLLTSNCALWAAGHCFTVESAISETLLSMARVFAFAPHSRGSFMHGTRHLDVVVTSKWSRCLRSRALCRRSHFFKVSSTSFGAAKHMAVFTDSPFTNAFQKSISHCSSLWPVRSLFYLRQGTSHTRGTYSKQAYT
ncbi:hypothetical protein BJX64DRAFT_253454 [Aspergillus heterothallicus]